MSEAITLLVGGTKVLEKELQTALPEAPLTSVATMEEAAKILGEKPVLLVVLGPTLRRALAMVSTLRREGQTEPKLMVVYRDDQRDEVKRHQKGKAVADSYIAQSRIQKEVGPAIKSLWTESLGDADLEEIPEDSLESLEVIEDATIMLDPIALPADDGEVLGAFDSGALTPLPELEALDDVVADELVEEIEALDDVEILADEGEELEAIELDAVEELTADDDEELVVEDLEAVELVEETQAITEVSLAADLIEDIEPAAAPATSTPAPVAAEPAQVPVAAVEVAPAQPVAAAPAAAPAPVATAPAAAAPGAAEPARPISGAHAMLGELSSFMEKLQDAASSISRLENENDQLRAQLAAAQAAATKSADAERLQAQVRDLELRLTGAEEARNAAVEARMRAEQQLASGDEESSRLRAANAALQGQADSAQAQVNALQGQLDARKKAAADAANALLQLATQLGE